MPAGASYVTASSVITLLEKCRNIVVFLVHGRLLELGLDASARMNLH